jgi:hypothetical protein
MIFSFNSFKNITFFDLCPTFFKKAGELKPLFAIPRVVVSCIIQYQALLSLIF